MSKKNLIVITQSFLQMLGSNLGWLKLNSIPNCGVLEHSWSVSWSNQASVWIQHYCTC